MPAIPLAALIPILISGATAGIQLGESLAGVGTPSTPKPPDTAAADAAAKAAQATQEKEAIAQQAPSIQAQLGGSVSPDYYIDAATKGAGFSGDTNLGRQALSGFLGLGGDSSSSGTAQGFGGVGSPTHPFLPPGEGEGGGGGSNSNPFEQLLSQFYPGGNNSSSTPSGGYV